MKTAENTLITVETSIEAPVEKVWNSWTNPNHIIHWNFASDDWHCPKAENDVRDGGKFNWRMEAKDGSVGFDFSGEYTHVQPNKFIEETIDDGRKVKITFETAGNQTRVTEIFEAEMQNPVDLQKNGWQAILNNFKKHVEALDNFETLHFEILIEASPEKVYSIMLDKKFYSDWTSVFSPTSGFQGSWEKGKEIRFIGIDADGKTMGMISTVEENKPNQFVSLLHKGIIRAGEEIKDGPEKNEWAGAHENYIFEQQDGNTLLTIEVDSNSKFKQYLNETFPKALNRLKTICEQY